jgi:hypothetical protein
LRSTKDTSGDKYRGYNRTRNRQNNRKHKIAEHKEREKRQREEETGSTKGLRKEETHLGKETEGKTAAGDKYRGDKKDKKQTEQHKAKYIGADRKE